MSILADIKLSIRKSATFTRETDRGTNRDTDKQTGAITRGGAKQSQSPVSNSE